MNRLITSLVFLLLSTALILAACTAAPGPARQPTSTSAPVRVVTPVPVTPTSTTVLTTTVEAGLQITLQAGQTQTAANQATISVNQTETSPAFTPSATNTPTPTETPTVENLGKIAYTSCPSGDFFSCEIFVMNTDGSNPVQLTDNGYDDRSPAWPPDGAKIAFRSNRDGYFEIYVMNTDGSEQIRLTESNFSTSNPAWSPDGTKIAFIAQGDYGYELYTMNPDGSDLTKISSDGNFMFDPTWSPDGTKLALIVSTSPASDEIFIMNADGTNLTRLLNTPIGVQNFAPAWSPDGTRIAFGLHDGDLIFKIYTVNADGSNAVFLRNGWSPSWSPDGSQIIYGSCKDDSNNQCGIFVMDADGSNPVQLTNNTGLIFDLSWLHKTQPQIIQHPDCTSDWTRLEAGSTAKVSEASATPNRVRSGPSTAEEIIFLIHPGTEMKIIEGPVCADGLVFWKVESDIIPGGAGWTAEGDGTTYWLEPEGP